jgi:hypothetical protein
MRVAQVRTEVMADPRDLRITRMTSRERTFVVLLAEMSVNATG